MLGDYTVDQMYEDMRDGGYECVKQNIVEWDDGSLVMVEKYRIAGCDGYGCVVQIMEEEEDGSLTVVDKYYTKVL